MSVPIRDAATVLALREQGEAVEVFMVRRDSRLGFLGGAHVFPGGAVDEEDRSEEALALLRGLDTLGDASRIHPDPVQARALLIAAIRELFEEAGILLACTNDGHGVDLVDGSERASRLLEARRASSEGRGGFARAVAAEDLVLDVSGLRYFAHWITPDRERKRFDTRFFLARAPAGQLARHCEIESTEGEWMSPARALERYRARDIELVPPTIATLETLSRFTSVDGALAAFLDTPIPSILPKITMVEETFTILYPGDSDYESGQAAQPGGRAVNRLILRDGLWCRP